MDEQTEKLLSDVINEETEFNSNITLMENYIALRRENIKLKLLLQEVQKHYKSKDLGNQRMLVQCSVALTAAADRLERQKQIIDDLQKEINGSDTDDDVPDSTT